MPPLAHAFSLPTLFAAQFTPITPDFQLNVWSLLSVVLGILAVAGYFRRRPTVDVDLSKLQSSIETLQTTVDTLCAAQAKHAGHDTEIAALKEHVRALALHRETDGETHRRHIAHLTREIFTELKNNATVTNSKIDSLAGTMNQIFRDVAADIGALKEATKRYE